MARAHLRDKRHSTRGRSIGHTIGFPTANLQPYLPDQLLPKSGVYAGYAAVSGGIFPAMINVGKNPTVSTEDTTKIEAIS